MSAKLATVFAVLTAIGILAVAVTLEGLQATRTSVREATGPADRARQEAMDMRIHVADSVVGVTEYLRTGRPEQRAEVARAHRHFADHARAYVLFSQPGEERRLGEQAQRAFDEVLRSQSRLLDLRDRRRAGYAAINGRYEDYEDVIDEAVVDNAAVAAGSRARETGLALQGDLYSLLADLGAHLRRDGQARRNVLENLDEIDEGLTRLAGLPIPASSRTAVEGLRVRSRRTARIVRAVLEDEAAISAQQRRSARASTDLTLVLERRLIPLARQRYAEARGRAASASERVARTGTILIPSFLMVVLAGTAFLTRSISSPVRRLVAGIRAVERGGLGHRIGWIGDNEIGALAGHVDRLVDRLERTTVSRDQLETSQGQLRELTAELAHQAGHDLVTGLVNRMGFERRLAAAVDGVAAGGPPAVLCYVDLDQFKVVNDTCGHGAGDELLQQVAAVLDESIRGEDLVARLGGDEFVLLLNAAPEDAKRLANRLRERLATARFEWGERRFSISASIGVVPITGTQTPALLLASADAACYAAKDQGRDRVQVYVPEDSDLAARHGEMLWTPEIVRALDENRLVLYRQPIAPLSDRAELRPHYETLVRLVDDRGELVPPGAFIPAAERYGLIRRIDQWVLTAAISHLGTRHAGATEPVELCAINLSATSVSDPLLPREIEALLDEHKVPGAALCFEITETAAIANLDTARHLISQLQARGCQFALDDFGRGLSSFAYLRELPVDVVKIDGSFIRGLAHDDVSEAIVRAVHHVARSIGAQTVAEFVEDEDILERVRALGIDYAQGYAIGRPRPLLDHLAGAPPRHHVPATG